MLLCGSECRMLRNIQILNHETSMWIEMNFVCSIPCIKKLRIIQIATKYTLVKVFISLLLTPACFGHL